MCYNSGMSKKWNGKTKNKKLAFIVSNAESTQKTMILNKVKN